MKEHYDIFISYRRDGGFETAKHLNDLLVYDGYTVSFDIDTLREGDFDTVLLLRIEQCTDFILVVDRHAFDRSTNPEFDSKKDWLRIELAEALRLKKNIIPILLAGATFPDNLPQDVAAVATKNGPEYSRAYFDEFYKKLKSFLNSLPRNLYAKQVDESYAQKDALPEVDGKVILDQDTYNKLMSDFNAAKSNSEPKIDSETIEGWLRKGKSYYINQEYIEAVTWFRKAAEQGHALAQGILGYCYYNGLGVAQEYTDAVNWCRKAAGQGLLMAQLMLGVCYEYGDGVKKDVVTAVYWYRKAAAQGQVVAQGKLKQLGYSY